MFGKAGSLFGDYVRERFPAVLYGPLALLIVLAGMRPSVPRAILSLVLLFEFRLWDDLADHARDKLRHPDRVLVRAPSLAPFRALLLGAGGAGFLLIFVLVDLRRALVAVAVHVAFFLWYARARSPALAPFVVLAKYPLFAVIVDGGGGAPTLHCGLGSAFLYVTFVLFEWTHDPALFCRPKAPLVVATAAIVGAALSLVIDFRIGTLLQWCLTAATILTFAIAFLLFRSRRDRFAPVPLRYGVFAPCLLHTVSLYCATLATHPLVTPMRAP